MTVFNQICTRCGLDGMSCTCENFHPSIFVLTEVEVKALARVLEKQYINYEDEEALKAVRKIMELANV